MWAVCLVLFFGFLCKGSVLPASHASFRPTHFPCRNDVIFANQGATIQIRHTKTIQYRQRVLSVPYLAAPPAPSALPKHCSMLCLLPQSRRRPHLCLFRISTVRRSLGLSSSVESGNAWRQLGSPTTSSIQDTVSAAGQRASLTK